MAERWAVATGAWSDTATWNGGTLPGASDDVHANGFTVTIDQNVTVLSLRTTSGTTPVAGGGFSTSGTCEVNAESIAGMSLCLTINSGGIQNGNSTGGSASGAHGSYVLSGGIIICHSASDDIGNGVQVANDATVVLGPGVTTSDLYITGTRYIIGNANHPFVSLLKSTVSFG